MDNVTYTVGDMQKAIAALYMELQVRAQREVELRNHIAELEAKLKE